MKPIRIINTNFELLGEIDNYESMHLTRRWHDIDSIEFVINKYKRHTDLLQRGNIVIVGSDVHKSFIIKHREIELTDDGKLSENWVIKGLGLKSIMNQRITVPPETMAYDKITSDAETVMLWYVYSNISESSDAKRNISQLLLATNQHRGITLEWSSRYKNLAEELTKISTYSGLGWNVSLDLSQNRWVYEASEGKDLTVDQSVLPPVIFSPQFDSLQSLQYSESDLNYRNLAYVGGQGEGELRRIVEIGADAGLQRNEVFIDARDVEEFDENDQPIPQISIDNTLMERGQQKLSEHTQELYLEGQILTKSPFKYEIDYDLGDIVTIQEKEWGVTTNSRITEIKEIYETGGFKIEAVFGKDQPTIVDKIKENLDTPIVEKDLNVYTKAEVDVQIAGVDQSAHNHDGVYSPVNHTHATLYSPLNHNHTNVYAPYGYGVGQPLSSNAINDIDSLFITGMYFANTGATTLPPGVSNAALLVMGYSAEYITHTLIDWRTGKTYTRTKGDGAPWKPWDELQTKALETPWIALPFTTGWATYAGYSPVAPGYMRDAQGFVHLRGLIARVSGSSTIPFSLPAGFRPTGLIMLSVFSDAGMGRVDLYGDSGAFVNSGGSAFVSLDSVSPFKANV